MLRVSGLDALRVREMMEPGMLAMGAATVECSAWLAGGSEGGVDELMRISVNLATRPFVELRPLFARLRLAMGVLALLAIGLGYGLHSLNARAAGGRGADGCIEGEDARVREGAAGERGTDAATGEPWCAGAVAVSECAVCGEEF